MIPNEAVKEVQSISEFLAWFPDPVIEGLTIVAAGYLLFRLERRARRKEMAILVQVILMKTVAVITAAFEQKRGPALSSVIGLRLLRWPYEEFTGITDRIGILGARLVLPINKFFGRLYLYILLVETEFRWLGPTGLEVNTDSDKETINLVAAKFLLENFDDYVLLTSRLKDLAPELFKVSGSSEDKLFVDVTKWASNKTAWQSLIDGSKKSQQSPQDSSEM